MRALDHQCGMVRRSAFDEWRIHCSCGWSTKLHHGGEGAVDAFVTHVIAQFAIERPPEDVIENARRAFDSRRSPNDG